MIGIRKRAVETTKTVEAVETAWTSKNGKESKGGEYPRNLV